LQTRLGRLLYSLGVFQSRIGGFFLAFTVQKTIVGLHNLEDDLAMGIVEKKVCR
jgi:hypothetical protein